MKQGGRHRSPRGWKNDALTSAVPKHLPPQFRLSETSRSRYEDTRRVASHVKPNVADVFLDLTECFLYRNLNLIKRSFMSSTCYRSDVACRLCASHTEATGFVVDLNQSDVPDWHPGMIKVWVLNTCLCVWLLYHNLLNVTWLTATRLPVCLFLF